MSPQYRCGPNLLDLDRGLAVRDEQEVRLTTKERALLLYLADRAGETVPRDEVLVQVWGYPRPVRTRAVDNVVRRIRQKIEDDPSDPRFLFTVYGEGYRLLVEPVAPTSQPAGDPRATEDAPHPEPEHTPPRPQDPVPSEWLSLSPFVGRVQALADLEQAWGRTRVVQVLGPGGVGKTRLAREHGRRLVERGARAVFCDLSDARSAFDVRRAISRALGGWLDTPDTEAHAAAVERAARAAGEALLVLDNAEQVVEEVAEVVARLIYAAPELHLLVTSRRRLPGARVVPVTLGPLSAASCLALLRDRVGHLPSWRDEDLLALAKLLDGQPLALELAASRCAVLDPAELLRRAGASLTLLRARTGPERHRALDACVRVSWDLLEPAGRDALTRLAVFPGGFTVPLVEEVLEEAEDEPLDLLQALVDASLVTRMASGRLQLTHTVRLFALSHLVDEAAAREAMERALAALCRDMVARNRDRVALDSLGDEHDNLVAAVRTAQDPDRRAWMALGLEAWLSVRGAHATRVDLLQASCAAPPTDPELHARVLIALTRCLSTEYHPDTIQESAARALELLPESAPGLRAKALQAIAWGLADAGELDTARVTFERAVALAPPEVLPDVQLDRLTLGFLEEEEVQAFERAVRRGPRDGVFVQLSSARGAMLRHGGDTVAAEGWFREGLGAAEELGWTMHACGLHTMLGDLLMGMGHDVRARVHLLAALKGGTPMGLPSLLAPIHANLGGLDLIEGDVESARHHLDEAVDLGRTASAVWMAIVLAFRAAARAQLDALDEARVDVDLARRTMESAKRRMGDVHAALAVDLAQGIVDVIADGALDRSLLELDVGDDADLRVLHTVLRRVAQGRGELRLVDLNGRR